MPRAIGYVRVSTQGQADDGVSLAAQRAKIAAWCEASGYELAAVFEDRGISGSSMKGREGLQSALEATGRGMALVAYSISRLARSTRDMIDIAERLKRRGADLVSLTERIDTSTAAGHMVFQMLAVLAEFERNQTAERTRTALAHKRASGEVYGPVPFGFRAVEQRLEAVAAEAQIVAKVLRMRSAGKSFAAIADYLNVQGISGKQGGRWYASTVRYLINRQQRAAA
jgi:site-specific DNA recombinase